MVEISAEREYHDKHMNRPDDETAGIQTVIHEFAKTWTLLLQYDEDSLARTKQLHSAAKTLAYDKAKIAIEVFKAELIKRGKASDLFGLERDHQLQGILGNINQTYFATYNLEIC